MAMRQAVPVILLTFLLAVPAAGGPAGTYAYRIGAIYGTGNIKAGETPYFSFDHDWGFTLGTDSDRLALTFSLLWRKNYADSAASGHFGFFADRGTAPLACKFLRAGFDVDYRLAEDARLCPTVGAGIGYAIWKYTDPAADTVIRVAGDRDNTVDFSAAEMFFSTALGAEFDVTHRLVLHLKSSLDYLTGVGTSFGDEVNDRRGRLVIRLNLSLAYRFGARQRQVMQEVWPSADAWSRVPVSKRPTPPEWDADGDGIEDKRDKCPDTPPGALVDGSGCPRDSDQDGVIDGIDDCPNTPRAARGHIDVFGCPVDGDFDGVPDYLDSCRHGPVGATVDADGCPIDTDGDGVFDGIDDCPHTSEGVEVDARGCIDIAFLRDTMRINIDYSPGSFEVDMRTRQRLQPLIKKLQVLSHVTVTILGYTDNVGPAEANQQLSEKRANRLRDWLVAQGIDANRLTVIGRGETNFVASNQTAEGRAKNRRIELVFAQ